MADLVELAELFEVDVNELPGTLALVATRDSAGSSALSLLSPRCRKIRLTLAGEIASSLAICAPVWWCRRKTSTMSQVACGIWLGERCVSDERSRKPSMPAWRNRSTHSELSSASC